MSVTLESAPATSSRQILDSKQLATSANSLAGRFDDRYTTVEYIMSDVPINAPESSQPLAWTQELLHRLSALETQTRTDPIVVDSEDPDPHVVARTQDLDFSPYPEFREALPGLAKDFFRNPLPEAERRRFLAQCPRNLERNYQPPVLNQVDVRDGCPIG